MSSMEMAPQLKKEGSIVENRAWTFQRLGYGGPQTGETWSSDGTREQDSVMVTALFPAERFRV